MIEIMIVILIIGILLVLILPNMVNSKYQAQWSACVQYERTIAAALESYNASEKSYPDSLDKLTATSPPYIEAIPTCPSDGKAYVYLPYSTNSQFSTYDGYTIYCPGVHYLVLPLVQQGYPQYTPDQGIRQKNANE